MSRRGSPMVQVLIVVAVVCLFLYGFYCYHDQHTRFKRSEETVDKLKEKSESLSAQLQVLYEHKSRLETDIAEEKKLHKITKQGLQQKLQEMENKMANDKAQCDGFKTESEKLKTKGEEDSANFKKLTQDFKHLQQEQNNDITRLNDDLANIRRRYEDCEKLRPAHRPSDHVSLSQPLVDRQRADNAIGGIADQQPLQPLVIPDSQHGGQGAEFQDKPLAAIDSLQRVESQELEQRRVVEQPNAESLPAIQAAAAAAAAGGGDDVKAEDYDNDIEKHQINKRSEESNQLAAKDGLGL